MAVELDKEFALPFYSPVCTLCQHLHIDEIRRCDAFPAGIPKVIWVGTNDHTKPFKGDHGIQFEKVTV